MPFDIDPCTNVCIDLTITDSAGCQVDTNLVLDVRGLPSIEGLTVLEAFGDEAAITALDPICDFPSPNNTTPTDCPGAAVLQGDTTSLFCANTNFLLKAQGAQVSSKAIRGGCASDPSLGTNLITQQDTCAFGLGPCPAWPSMKARRTFP